MVLKSQTLMVEYFFNKQNKSFKRYKVNHTKFDLCEN